MRTTHWIAMGLVACGGTTTTEETPADEPSPYVVDAPDPGQPTASLTEIGDALQAALDETLDISAVAVEDAYDAAMVDRTYECPYEYVTPDGTYWYDSCDTDQGAAYDGYVFALGESDVPDPYTGLLVDYWYAFGAATITTDEDHHLELSGGVTRYEVHGDYAGTALHVYYTDVLGTFRWDGPEAAGTWLDRGLDPDLSWQATSYADLAATLWLDGGFAGFHGGWAVAYDENVLGHALLGLPCEDEPSGTVGVRAPDGTWYDVRFDGTDDPADPDFEPAACDGCGTAFFQGEAMGEVCADFSGVLAKAVRPW